MPLEILYVSELIFNETGAMSTSGKLFKYLHLFLIHIALLLFLFYILNNTFQVKIP